MWIKRLFLQVEPGAFGEFWLKTNVHICWDPNCCQTFRISVWKTESATWSGRTLILFPSLVDRTNMFVLILMVDESLWMSFDQSSCPAFQINNFIITDINFIWQSSPREVYRPPDRPFHSSRQVTFWLKRLTDVQHHIFSLHVSLLSVHWQIIEEVRRRRRKRRRKRITEGAGLKGQVHASCLHSALLTSLLAVKDRINHAKDIPERKERNRRWREEGRWVKTRQRERERESVREDVQVGLTSYLHTRAMMQMKV